MNIRRYYIPDSIVFITQVVQERTPIFAAKPYVDLLRTILHRAQELYPFRMLAYVFMPDHFHLLVRPIGDVTHSQIMHSLKPNYTKEYKIATGITGSMKLWQKRYWDHIIRSEQDLEAHLHYIHYNPVKHGYVAKPEDWRDSSYAYWQVQGIYPEEWGWTLPSVLSDLAINE
jgi:putative transposase